ncbi:esterase/lipase family protein [Rhodococcus gannanensis]|uniref:Esterase/lipase family protein n=1 Tax=Rhodococcus gannanensis TaxID=1960308 RepID=A0ABW4P7U6_9NOCA
MTHDTITIRRGGGNRRIAVRRFTAAAVFTLCATLTAVHPAASAAPPEPPDTGSIDSGSAASNFVTGFGTTLVRPGLAPAGTNDWSCLPSATHPRPVVLVHGTWENSFDNFAALAPALAEEGFCVFAPDYGRVGPLDGGGVLSILPNTQGLGPIEQSAHEIGGFVDRVLAATGAAQVDMVGHSQGGLAARQYLAFAGGADPVDPSRNKVANLVTMGATNHGTTLLGAGVVARAIDGLVDLDPALGSVAGRAPIQQMIGSDLLDRLDAAGDTVPGVAYTVIATRYDEITTPYASTFLTAGPGASVRNVTLQDGCVDDLSDHASLTYSPRAIDWVKHAFDPVGTPEAAIRCEPHAAVLGGSDHADAGSAGSAGPVDAIADLSGS